MISLPKALPTIKINDRVQIRPINHPKYPNKPRPGFGTVIAIIGAGTVLTEDEAKEIYGDISNAKLKNDPIPITSFMKPRGVDLIVIKRDDPKDPSKPGFYVQPNTVPTPPLIFPLEIISTINQERTHR